MAVVLPTPPTDKEKWCYALNQNRSIFYLFCVLSSTMLFSGMYLFTFTSIWLSIYSLFVTFLLLYLFISYAIGIRGKSFDLEKYLSEANLTDTTATIDVYLPICGEPYEVLENTWKYVAQLEWPKELLNIYILDDGWSDAARDLAQSFGFNYIRRDNRPYLKKAGNIRNAFTQTNGKYIVILDADFCPRADFLTNTIGYLENNTDIAILQTPQFFEVQKNQSWVERGASSVQELFYRLIQVSRDTWGASICVGSCGIYRRAALEPMGGTYPIEHSEDLNTGFAMLETGLKVKYIPINLAKGVCPDTLPAFFIQQYRWCTGSTGLLTNKRFWKQKLSLMQRASYLSGMLYYFATAASIFLASIPSMLMVWVFPEHLVWFSIVFYGPSFLFGVFFMKWWTLAPYTLDVQRIRQVSYWAHFFALKDKFFKTTVPWVPTGAATTSVQRFTGFRDLLFYWATITTVVVLTGATRNMHDAFDYNFYPTLFFTMFNYYINISILKEQ